MMINNIFATLCETRPQMLRAQLHRVLAYLYLNGHDHIRSRNLP